MFCRQAKQARRGRENFLQRQKVICDDKTETVRSSVSVSKKTIVSFFILATSSSGKTRDCKSLIRGFDSRRGLQLVPSV